MKFWVFLIFAGISFCSCKNNRTPYCWSCVTITYSTIDPEGEKRSKPVIICNKTEYEISKYEKANTDISKGFIGGIKVGYKTSCEEYR